MRIEIESPPWTPVSPVRRLTLEQYVEGIVAGRRHVLSRVLTLIESRRPEDRDLAQQVITTVLPRAGNSIRVGMTGMPGAGKSTLIETLGLSLASRGHKVAVLAVDPSSRVSGGSILADKTRMADLARDPNAFIRPSPSGEALGGVALSTREAMLVCEAAGHDIVIVETVGVGQSQTVVADMVDTFLVVLIAGAGDNLQGIKRGLLEAADIIAVNKADGDNLLRVEQAVAQYRNTMLLIHPPGGLWRPPVLACSAMKGAGIDALWDSVLAHRAAFERAELFHERRRIQTVRWMWDLVNDRLQRALRENPAVRDLAHRLEAEVREGRVTPAAATELILKSLGLVT